MRTIILVAALFLGVAFATKGLDIANAMDADTASCLYDDGYKFMIVRCWHSTGKVDTNVVASVQNAWDAGFSNVDVYFYPCYSCGSAAYVSFLFFSNRISTYSHFHRSTQVSTAVSYLKSNSVDYGMMWFDIEGTWGSSTTYPFAINSLFKSFLERTKTSSQP